MSPFRFQARAGLLLLSGALVLGGCDSVAAPEIPAPAGLVPEVRVPARLVVVSGDGQRGTLGEALPQPVEVRAEYANGLPVVGQTVSFEVTPGGGQIAATAVTGLDGVALARWTLGTTSGVHRLTARLTVEDGVVLEAELTAAAPAGPLAALTAARNVYGGVVNTPVADSVAVRATDRYGNPVAGVPVTWTDGSGATPSPAASTTDSAGWARTSWTLGSRGDVAYGLVAATAGVPPIIIVATAATVIVPLAGDGLTVEAGTVVNVAVALDGPAGRVPDVPVEWTVLSGFGHLSEPVTRTRAGDHSGTATVTWTLGPDGGEQRLRARSGSLERILTVTATSLGSRTRVTRVPGRVLDAFGDEVISVVWLDSTAAGRRVMYRPAWNNPDYLWFDAATVGETGPIQAHLFREGGDGSGLIWSDDRVYEYRDGALADLGPLRGELNAEGGWAAWSTGSSVVRRELATGVSVAVAAAPVSSLDVGANGDVVYFNAGGGWRYRDGATASITLHAAQPLESVETDGVSLVYLLRAPDGERTLYLDQAGGDLELTGSYSGTISAALNQGWIGYSAPPYFPARRSPAGTVHQLSARAGPVIEAIAPDGSVVYWRPESSSFVVVNRFGVAYPVGSRPPGSRVRWRSGRFLLMAGEDVYILSPLYN
jgi:hypothetical protein